ncbi:hypothetical protein SK128_000055 [Halocaridina rubra]|uniref:C2H2-type domain-containing protein n=1 Tax=Halocaridina rubra TaxID=373956 RepID=A0AAN8XJZ7_HALRR
MAVYIKTEDDSIFNDSESNNLRAVQKDEKFSDDDFLGDEGNVNSHKNGRHNEETDLRANVDSDSLCGTNDTIYVGSDSFRAPQKDKKICDNDTSADEGQNAFECEICHKSFARIEFLRKHSMFHTGERPYVCDICDRAFTNKGNLTKHAKIHIEEQLGVCSICSKSCVEEQLSKLDSCDGSSEALLACRACYNKDTNNVNIDKSVGDQEVESLPSSNIDTQNTNSSHDVEQNPNTIYLIDNVHVKEERCDRESEEDYDIGSEELSSNIKKEYDVECMDCDVLIEEEKN